jgi:hypothetical protein
MHTHWFQRQRPQCRFHALHQSSSQCLQPTCNSLLNPTTDLRSKRVGYPNDWLSLAVQHCVGIGQLAFTLCPESVCRVTWLTRAKGSTVWEGRLQSDQDSQQNKRRGVTGCFQAATPQRTPARKRMLRTAQLRLSLKRRLNPRKTSQQNVIERNAKRTVYVLWARPACRAMCDRGSSKKQ